MFRHNKHFGTKFRYSNLKTQSVKTVLKCLRKLKVFLNKFDILVDILMSSLRAIVIRQKYLGNHGYRLKSIFLHLYLTRGVVLCAYACINIAGQLFHMA